MNDLVRLPRWNHETKPYWDALHSEKLLYQQCMECEEVVFHPRAICPYCLGARLEWRESSGRGRIYSFTLQYRAPVPEHQERMPIALGIVEMDEGFHMFTEFVDGDLGSLAIGSGVKVFYDRITDELVLPKFVLERSGPADTGKGSDA